MHAVTKERTRWGLYTPTGEMVTTCMALTQDGAILFLAALPMPIRRGIIPSAYNVHAIP